MNQKELRRLATYDKQTGLFSIGKTNITHGSNGYLYIRINKKQYPIHRLIHIYVNGDIPAGFHMDHINHNRTDNRWCNLRCVPMQENLKNRSMYNTNTSGRTGVSWVENRKKWQSIISVDGKNISLGRHTNLEDAIKAREEAEIKYGFHKNHGKGK